MIDDGLHSSVTQLRSLALFLDRLADNGFAVIEDIHDDALPLWEVVGSILWEKYAWNIFRGKLANCFAVRNLEQGNH